MTDQPATRPPAIVPLFTGKLSDVWAKVVGAFSSLRRSVIDIAAVAGIIAGILFLVSLLVEKTIVIEAPLVPKALQEQGVTPVLLTQMLQARVEQVYAAAQSRKPTSGVGPENAPPKIETIGLNLSLNTLVHMAERVLGVEEKRRFSMSLVCTDKDCAKERIRLHLVALTEEGVEAQNVPFRLNELSKTIEEAADYLVLTFEPYISSAYHYRRALAEQGTERDRQVTEAETIASRMILEGHENAEWAYNLLAQIELFRGTTPSAVTGRVLMDVNSLDRANWYYAQALREDPHFVPALVNWGSLFFRTGHVREGHSMYFRAMQETPNDSMLHSNLGIHMFNNCQWSQAREEFDRAKQLEPRNHFAYRGLALLTTWQEKNYQRGLAFAKTATLFTPPEYASTLPMNPGAIATGDPQEIAIVDNCGLLLDPSKKNISWTAAFSTAP